MYFTKRIMFKKVLLSAIIVNCLFFSNVNARLYLDWDSDRYPIDRQLHEDVLDTELCQRQLVYLTSDIVLLARFLDAGMRVPRGILMGNTVDLGSFHQCMAINEEAEDMTISGKYCRIHVPVEQDLQLPVIMNRSLMTFHPSDLQVNEDTLRMLKNAAHQKVALKSGLTGLETGMGRIGPDSPLANLNFNLAVCIPRPCSTEQAISGLLFNLTGIDFEFSEASCRLPDDRPWVAADYVASVVFSIIGFLTVISTCYDLYQSLYLKKGSKEIRPAYTSFSVYTNTRRLLTFNSSPGSLECLDGIRALAMIWVILGHTFFTVSVVLNPIEAFQWSISPQAIWITAGPLSVDTFFFLSGLLLVYTTIGKVGRMQLLKNLHVFYLHRLLRLFPILAVVVLFESSFFMHVTDGPLWENVASQVFRCREFWWTTLLHLQNFVNPQEACIGVSWYLAIDVHLHILSPIVLFWILTSNRAAWTALNTSLVVTLIASTGFIFYKNLPSGIISPNRQDDMGDFFVYYYLNILTRASPFLIGMVYGYLLHLWRKKKLQVPKIVTTLFFFCFLLTMLGVMYCSYVAMGLDWDNQLADNFFNSFLRPLWALALGWIVFACVQGIAEPINWFLSLQMWKLPARLSYAMYLIHMTIMVLFHSAIFTPIYFTVPLIIFNFMAFLLITMLLAFFVTLLIDSPFTTIFKLILDRGYKKPETSNTTTKENDPEREVNGKPGYNFAPEVENGKLEPLSNLGENGDLNRNINGRGNTLLITK